MRTQVKGFGPVDLIPLLRCIEWQNNGTWRSFLGFDLADNTLVEPRDERCSVKYRVTLTDDTCKAQFAVEGFGFNSIPLAMNGSKKIRIAGAPFMPMRSEDYPVPYTLTVEAL
jgi:hypothetical protein